MFTLIIDMAVFPPRTLTTGGEEEDEEEEEVEGVEGLFGRWKSEYES